MKNVRQRTGKIGKDRSLKELLRRSKQIDEKLPQMIASYLLEFKQVKLQIIRLLHASDLP